MESSSVASGQSGLMRGLYNGISGIKSFVGRRRNNKIATTNARQILYDSYLVQGKTPRQALDIVNTVSDEQIDKMFYGKNEDLLREEIEHKKREQEILKNTENTDNARMAFLGLMRQATPPPQQQQRTYGNISRDNSNILIDTADMSTQKLPSNMSYGDDNLTIAIRDLPSERFFK